MISEFFYDLSNIEELKELMNKEDNYELKILNKHLCNSPLSNQQYKVIRYNKNLLCKEYIPTYGLCRSIIFNKNNKVIGFSPPKSIPSDEFILKYPSSSSSDEIVAEDIVAEEFIEGTMINVFWDPDCGLTGCWEISTRNCVGAETSFYKYKNAKTFRTMFLETLTSCNLNLDYLDKDFCYSFVLQHPENRIVVPFFKPQLYLVSVFTIIQSKNLLNIYPCRMKKVKECTNWSNTTVKFPETYEFRNYSDLIEKYASMNTSYNILGVVFYNVKTGERCKVRNPVYEQVRQLKGNQPKLQYQYLVLRKEGRVSEYLTYFPETKKIFSQFRDQMHLFTKTLYSNYISCFIKKEKTLLEYPEQFRCHMFSLHQFFLNDLREKKLFVNSSFVIKYVNDLHPSQPMFSLNYQMRKRNIDFQTMEPIDQDN